MLKGEIAETDMTLDEREKNDETNPISRNPLVVKELWRGAGAAAALPKS